MEDSDGAPKIPKNQYNQFPLSKVISYANNLLSIRPTDYPKKLNNPKLISKGCYQLTHSIEDLKDLIIENCLLTKIITPDQLFELLELNKKINSEDDEICGRVFEEGELVYSCKDCAIDPTCCFCQPCFLKSIHVNCNHVFHPSQGNGGCCDCGDPEAWKKGYVCDIHCKKNKNNSDSMETSTENFEKMKLEEFYMTELRTKIKPFFNEMMRYIIEALSSSKQMHKKRWSSFGQNNMYKLLDKFGWIFEDDSIGSIFPDEENPEKRKDKNYWNGKNRENDIPEKVVSFLKTGEIDEMLDDLGYQYPDWMFKLIDQDSLCLFMCHNNERHNYTEVDNRLSGLHEKSNKNDRENIAKLIDTVGRTPIFLSKMTDYKARNHVAVTTQAPGELASASLDDSFLPDISLLHSENNHADDDVDQPADYFKYRFLRSLAIAYNKDKKGVEGIEIAKNNRSMGYRSHFSSYERINHRPFYTIKVVEHPYIVVAHQEVAVQMMELLVDLIDNNPVFRDVIVEVILENIKQLFSLDIFLWKSAKQVLLNLIWQSCFRKLTLRTELGRLFAKYYIDIMIDSIDDDHEESFNIMSLGVQVCTTPSIAQAMMYEQGGMLKIMYFLMELYGQELDDKFNPIEEKPTMKETQFLVGIDFESETDCLELSGKLGEREENDEDLLESGIKIIKGRMETYQKDEMLFFCAQYWQNVLFQYISEKTQIPLGIPLGTTLSTSRTRVFRKKFRFSEKTLTKLNQGHFCYYFFSQIKYMLAQPEDLSSSTTKSRYFLAFAWNLLLFMIGLEGVCSYDFHHYKDEHVKMEQNWYGAFTSSHRIWDVCEKVIEWFKINPDLIRPFLTVAQCVIRASAYKYPNSFDPVDGPGQVNLDMDYFYRQAIDTGIKSYHYSVHRLMAHLNRLVPKNNEPTQPSFFDNCLGLPSENQNTRKKLTAEEIQCQAIHTQVFAKEVLYTNLWVKSGANLPWNIEKIIEHYPYAIDSDLIALQSYFAKYGREYIDRKPQSQELSELAFHETISKPTLFLFGKPITPYDMGLYGLNYDYEKLPDGDRIPASPNNLSFVYSVHSRLRKFLIPDLNIFSGPEGLGQHGKIDPTCPIKVISTDYIKARLLVLIQMLEERFNGEVNKSLSIDQRNTYSLSHILSINDFHPSKLQKISELDKEYVRRRSKKLDDSSWETTLQKVAIKKSIIDNSNTNNRMAGNRMTFSLKDEYLEHFNPYSKIFRNLSIMEKASKNQTERRNIKIQKEQEELQNDNHMGDTSVPIKKFRNFFTANENLPKFDKDIQPLLYVLRSENFMLYESLFIHLRIGGLVIGFSVFNLSI